MKIFWIAVLAIFTLCVHATENQLNDRIIESVCHQFLEDGTANDSVAHDFMSVAGRGCCSHHHGQCGCSGGAVMCCDGATSPSCGCDKSEPLPPKSAH
jgi:hypothetical protein